MRMSKKVLNATMRQLLVSYVKGNGKVSVISAINFIVGNFLDPRVTRERASGNISALVCYYKELSYCNGYLM